MSNRRKARRARRLLKAHTKRGENRHVKSAAYRDKAGRLAAERDRRRPPPAAEPTHESEPAT